MSPRRLLGLLLAMRGASGANPPLFVPVDLPSVGLVWRAARAADAAAAAGCSDGSDDACACVLPDGGPTPTFTNRSSPTLVHVRIPSVAGEAIEAALAQAGVLSGRRRHSLGLAPLYPRSDLPCPVWHAPPTRFVPNSFAVLANPYERLLRGLCAGSPDGHAGTDGPGEGQLHPTNATEGCPAFRKGPIKKLLQLAGKAARPAQLGLPIERVALGSAHSCLGIPQWAYAQHAEWVFTLEQLPRALPALAAKYGLQGLALSDLAGRASSCPAYVHAGECLNAELVDRVTSNEREAFAFFDGDGFPAAWEGRRASGPLPVPEPLFPRLHALANPLGWQLDPTNSYDRCPPDQQRGRGLLWLFWGQGWDQAPDLCRAVAAAWKAHHPSWTVRLIDARSAREWVNLTALYPAAALPDSRTAAYADVLRTELIFSHGGVWADATMYPAANIETSAVPLDVPFHAIRFKPHKMTLLTNSLLVSACDGRLLHRLVMLMRATQPWHTRKFEYFWWMYIFETELRDDLSFRHTWQLQHKAMAAPVHLFQPAANRMCKAANATQIIMTLKRSPTHKLSHRFPYATCRETGHYRNSAPSGKAMTTYEYIVQGHALQAMLRERQASSRFGWLGRRRLAALARGRVRIRKAGCSQGAGVCN
jgi:hypothetical protein